MASLSQTYQHFRASMSFPGVSRQRRINLDCSRTTARASSSRRAWSSTEPGDPKSDMLGNHSAIGGETMSMTMRTMVYGSARSQRSG